MYKYGNFFDIYSISNEIEIPISNLIEVNDKYTDYLTLIDNATENSDDEWEKNIKDLYEELLKTQFINEDAFVYSIVNVIESKNSDVWFSIIQNMFPGRDFSAIGEFQAKFGERYLSDFENDQKTYLEAKNKIDILESTQSYYTISEIKQKSAIYKIHITIDGRDINENDAMMIFSNAYVNDRIPYISYTNITGEIYSKVMLFDNLGYIPNYLSFVESRSKTIPDLSFIIWLGNQSSFSKAPVDSSKYVKFDFESSSILINIPFSQNESIKSKMIKIKSYFLSSFSFLDFTEVSSNKIVSQFKLYPKFDFNCPLIKYLFLDRVLLDPVIYSFIHFEEKTQEIPLKKRFDMKYNQILSDNFTDVNYTTIPTKNLSSKFEVKFSFSVLKLLKEESKNLPSDYFINVKITSSKNQEESKNFSMIFEKIFSYFTNMYLNGYYNSLIKLYNEFIPKINNEPEINKAKTKKKGENIGETHTEGQSRYSSMPMKPYKKFVITNRTCNVHPDVKKLFEYLIPRLTFLNLGVCKFPNPNSLIHCLLQATNSQYMEYFDAYVEGMNKIKIQMEQQRELLVLEIKKYLSQQEELFNIAKTQFYDREINEIKFLVNQPYEFFDSYYFGPALEEIFNINIVVFTSENSQSTEMYIETPRFSVKPISNFDPNRETVFLTKNWGPKGQPQNIPYPHYEIVEGIDVVNNSYYKFGSRISGLIKDYIESSTEIKEIQIQKNININNFSNDHIIKHLSNYILTQFVDDQGYQKGINIKIEHNNIWLITPPYKSTKHTISKNIIPAKINLALAFINKLILLNLGIEITSISDEVNENCGFWLSYKNIPNSLFIPIDCFNNQFDLSKYQKIKYNPVPFCSKKSNSLRITLMRKKVYCVSFLVVWVYNMMRFMRKYDVEIFIKTFFEPETDEYQGDTFSFYDISKLKYNLPLPIQVNDENQNTYYNLINVNSENAFSYLYDNIPSLWNGKYFLFPNTEFKSKIETLLRDKASNINILEKIIDGEFRIPDGEIKDINEKMKKKELRKIGSVNEAKAEFETLNGVFSGLYQTDVDFSYQFNTVIFTSDFQFQNWLKLRKIEKEKNENQRYTNFYEFIEDELRYMKTPYFIKGNENNVYMVQNVKHGIKAALYISQNWNLNKINLGYKAEVKELNINRYSLYNENSSGYIYSDSDYDIKVLKYYGIEKYASLIKV